MRSTCIAILLLLSTSALAETSPPLCVLDPAAMPESWLPSSAAEKALTSAKPWAASETDDSSKAIRKGLQEMFDYYAKQIRVLFEIELDAEDLAVMYSPNWDPQS